MANEESVETQTPEDEAAQTAKNIKAAMQETLAMVAASFLGLIAVMITIAEGTPSSILDVVWAVFLMVTTIFSATTAVHNALTYIRLVIEANATK